MKMTKQEAEQLRKENEFLRKQIKDLTEDPPDVPFTACDNSCCVCSPRGMSTNGGCRCSENKLRTAVSYWRHVATMRQAMLVFLRDGDPIESFDEMQAWFAVRETKQGS